MANSLDDLIRDLRKYEDRKVVVRELRQAIRKPVPVVRRRIKRVALDTLPHRGGLGLWVSKTRITAVIKLAGRSAGVSLKGGRNSTGARSDIKRIDKGRVRAPSWGRRAQGSWHTQEVAEGFFTKTAAEASEWRQAAVDAVNAANKTISGR